MEVRQELALTLRATRFEDRHLVVTALTENAGLITALAKNAVQSRRFGGCLEPFVAADWSLKRKPSAELSFLEAAQVRREFTGLRRSVERLAMASAMNEFLLRGLPPEEPAPEIFRLHANALAILDELAEPADPPTMLLVAYLGKLLQWGGTTPRLARCALCERGLHEIPEVHFDLSEADWSCGEHERRGGHARTVSAISLGELERALHAPIRAAAETTLSTDEQRLLFRVVLELAFYHVPGFDRGGFKSLELLGLGSSQLPPRSSPRWRAAEG